MPTKVTVRNKAYLMCVYIMVVLADQWGGIVKELCLGMRMFMVLGLFILLYINVYLTEFIFGVCVHPTEFPFKSLRVSDNKRLYLVNRR